MTEAPPLLVPISLQALLVNEKVRTEVGFERWTNVYRSLNEFLDPVPEPFGNLKAPQAGVHLHWKLPSALTHGTAAGSSTQVEYPYTPNRWMIARLASTPGSTAPQQLKAWILQSDYLGSDGSSPYADPRSPRGNVRTTGLGKRVAIEEWQGEAGGSLFLRATGTADVTFTAYQPGLVDVYSFIDDMKNVAENAVLTYLVAGWYSDPANDPLAKSTPEKLGWTILGDGATPSTSIFHALIHGLTWQTTTRPQRDDPDARSMQVGVGYTAIDALAAVLNVRAKAAIPNLEQKLQAFQYGVLQTLDGPDGSAQLELKIRQAWFGSAPGGTLWDIVAVSQGQTSADALDRGSVPLPPPLTPAQEQWLAALNVRQRDYDAASRELMTMQWDVFSLWWKRQRGPFVIEQQDALGIDVNVILKWIGKALDLTNDKSFVRQVLAAKTNVESMRGALPDPTSQTSIDKFAKEIPAGGTIALTLRPRALPPFFHPADPVVLVAGITPPTDAVDDSKPLPCRIAGAATTGVRVNNTPVTAATGRIGSTIQIPATTKMQPAIAAGIRALAVETYFADPNNAASIARNGLDIGDAGVVNALAAAIANGKAQISTITEPLQASFAFAKWRQAWSPLFLEWQLTWLPSVTTEPQGDFMPPREAQVGGGAKDNWPFVPDHWTFDGGDRVTKRGAEYYQWTAGDVWTQSPKVRQQTYRGRTFLTPQATSLFIRRLSDYAKLHPDRDLSDVLKLIDEIGATRFLSQALSGFNAAFLMRSLQQTPSPPPRTEAGNTLGDAIGDEYHGVPFVAKGDQDMDFGSGFPYFFPVRGGFFQFEQLRIVDAFGQVLDLLFANGNTFGKDQTFCPIRGAGMVPDSSARIAQPERRIKQAPRVVQPNRLDLRLLDANNDASEVFFTPGANPVCGWLLPNHLDRSIAVYDAPGNPLGELLVLADASGQRKVTWLPAPNVENPITDPANITNPHLRAALSAFTAASGGIPGDRAAAFRALYTSIDEALWMVDPAGGEGDQDLAVLIGRPLAVVRAQLRFELFGLPAVNQSWRDTLQNQTSGSKDVPFPIRLGSTELLDDGLIGYFTGTTYTTFNAVHPSTSVPSPYIAAIGAGNYLSLRFNQQSQNLTLLLDPFGTVHATTGILPAARLSLPPQFFKEALAKMAVTFRTGPVITQPSSIRIPMPAERNGTWTWIRHVTPGLPKTNWKVDSILHAGAEARLEDQTPHLLDGWLQFQPKDIASKE